MAYYGSNYPSSGPPPPPGGGYGGGAYNGNQYGSYQGGYQGGAYQTGGYQAVGYGGYQQSGAVPGFTVPAVQQCQQAYGASAGPAAVAPPASVQYQYAQQAMAQQSLHNTQWQMYTQMGLIETDEEDERRQRCKERRRRRMIADEDNDDDEEKQEIEERAKRAEAKARELQEKLANNDSLKTDLRARFVNELMRRQEVSGTFEETRGTIVAFDVYDADDPVAVWFSTKRDTKVDISGEDWDGLYDSEYLYDAMDGCGTNEQAIINVVATRCNAQRNRIMKEYKTAYGKDLIEDLTGELGGNFRECVLGCFETPARYDAWAVKKAIYGLGTDEATLIEILMTRTNAQIQELVQQYNQITYAKQKNPEGSIEEDIEGDTSGDFKRLLISACQGNRRLIDQNKLDGSLEEVMNSSGQWSGMFTVNYHQLCSQEKCSRMAQELYKAGEEKWGTDEKTFNRIFSTQDYYTLRVIWDEYVKLSQRDIINSVERETSGNFKKGLCAIAQNIKCRPMFFAQRLYKAMKGLGTDDSTLIRIVVSRSEIDMVQIKQCFLEQYKQTLWNFIKDDTSGDYRKLLLALVGKN